MEKKGWPRDINSRCWLDNKRAKKDFRRELKRVQLTYEQESVNETMRTAEYDKYKFWRIIKRFQGSVRVA